MQMEGILRFESVSLWFEFYVCPKNNSEIISCKAIAFLDGTFGDMK
jgi:hypothetical protein